MIASTIARFNRVLVTFTLAVATFFTLSCNDSPIPDPVPTLTPEPLPQCDASRTGAAPRARSMEDLRSAMSEGRIVGGTEAARGDWPWAAAITLRRQDGSLFQYCGGSLIAPSWVLTAAHCEVQVGDLVVLGRHDLSTADGTEHSIDFVLTHNAYDSSSNDNDIALIKLSQPSSQTPANLVDAADTNAGPGADSTVTGWGALAACGKSLPWGQSALFRNRMPV